MGASDRKWFTPSFFQDMLLVAAAVSPQNL